MDTMKNCVTTRILRFGLPITLLFLCTLLIWLMDADLRLARAVYESGKGWPGLNRFPWDLLYRYANAPAFLLAFLAGGILLGGFWLRKQARCRKQALFLLLLLLLGPGLLVNALLKDNVGRARPIDVQEFGGDFPFTQLWQHGVSDENRSFPSGHASVAFFLFAPWFILRQRNRVHAACWLAGGLAFGSLVGAARILQGGHFLSDVLWAGGLVYLCGEVLAQVMALDRDGADCWMQD
jgi:membrane-associated PAP2 superfamily phosphatase